MSRSLHGQRSATISNYFPLVLYGTIGVLNLAFALTGSDWFYLNLLGAASMAVCMWYVS